MVVLLFGRGKISSLMGDVAKGIKVLRKVCHLTYQKTVIQKTYLKIKTQTIKSQIKRLNLMPQIGWFEILIIVSIAIIVVGPKDIPFVLKKLALGSDLLKDMCKMFKMKFLV